MTTHYLDLENGNDANDGTSWAQAWLTPATGASAARTAPGDLIRIAKSPDPVSIGNATWNHLSKTVTLAAALTLLVDDCESGWVAANSATVTHPTTAHKSGSAAINCTKSSYLTSTLYAYKALSGAVDFSAYTHLSLNVRVDTPVADASRWVICLCSDTAGAVVVDSFAIPAMPQNGSNSKMRLARVGGGALGSAIQSIAIYSGSSAPTGNQDLQLDNINACTSFSICSLISKNGDAGPGGEHWFGIQSINGTTLLIDAGPNTLPSAGRGYEGATETVETFRRESIKLTANLGFAEDGAAGSPITYSGGWNTGSGLQDGMTVCDFQSQTTNGVTSARSYLSFERLACVRAFSHGWATSGTPTGIQLTDCWALCNGGSGFGIACTLGRFAGCIANGNTSSGFTLTAPANHLESCEAHGNLNNGFLMSSRAGNAQMIECLARNNAAAGFELSTTAQGCTLTDCQTSDNVTSFNCGGSPRLIRPSDPTMSMTLDFGAQVYMVDASYTTFTPYPVDYNENRVFSERHVDDYTHIFWDGGKCYQEATDFASPATGKMWTLLTSSAIRTSAYPLRLRLPGIAVVANKEVTVKAMLKKAHATQVVGRFVMPGNQIAGVDADVVATLADNTNEQELTLTFTPTASGVVVPEVWAEYVSGHAAVKIDRLTDIAQAA